MAVILCWRCGTLDIKSRPVDGALVIARGPRKRLEQALSACARHSYDGKTMLVPGVPEVETDDNAVAAAIAFQGMIRKRLETTRKGGA